MIHPLSSQSKWQRMLRRQNKRQLDAWSGTLQCLKDQYDAPATPIPPHLAALLKQLETQEQG
jgi:hypothetical protein